MKKIDKFEDTVKNLIYWGVGMSVGALMLFGAIKIYKNISSNKNLTNKEK